MRLLILLIILSAVAAGTGWLKRADISRDLMERGALSAMLAQPLVDLGDGLHVALCGAGGPLPDKKRSGPCVAIAAGKRLFIVDAGSGGARNLGLMRYPIGEIEAVFLTHFHSDHLDGLGELATLRWVQGGNQSPLPVIGPEGVGDIVSGFNQVYARDAIYRNEHHGDKVAPLSGHGMVAQSFSTPPEGKALRVFSDGGLTVDSFRVDHDPVKPAVGYLFRYRGRSVLVSGDTARSSNLETFAHKVDLLVHEALSPELVAIIHRAAIKTNNPTMEKITADIPDYHTTPLEAAEIAADAGVGHLLFYHIVPTLPIPGLDAAWLEGVRENFPRYTLGVDGTTISLPSGSTDIIEVRNGLDTSLNID